jgi:prepilin-type N-terminal cleavage/methylation domain-containing protein
MKKGFTLIELLAVTIILLIIIVIATPIVLNSIYEAKKGAFENNAKIIIGEIKRRAALDDEFDPTTINEDNVKAILGIESDNYESLTVSIVDEKINVLIVGDNKWDN